MIRGFVDTITEKVKGYLGYEADRPSSEMKQYVHRKSGIKVFVGRQDITALQVDAIVNAANPNLRLVYGVSGAIGRQGGEAIVRECENHISRNGPMQLTDTLVTTHGHLPCKQVIHVIGPTRRGSDSENVLRKATENVLEKAATLHCKSVAVPGIGAGISRIPHDTVSRIIVEAISNFCDKAMSSVKEIYLVDKDINLVRNWWRMMRSQPFDEEPSPGAAGGSATGARGVSGGSHGASRMHGADGVPATGRGRAGGHVGGGVDRPKSTVTGGGRGRGTGASTIKDISSGAVGVKGTSSGASTGKGISTGVDGGKGTSSGAVWDKGGGSGAKAVSSGASASKAIVSGAHTNRGIGSGAHTSKGIGSRAHTSKGIGSGASGIKGAGTGASGGKGISTGASTNKGISSGPVGAVGHCYRDAQVPKAGESELYCCICMCGAEEPKELVKCGHIFCKDCIDRGLAIKPACPICGEIYGKITGNQPKDGKMQCSVSKGRGLPGYENCGVITIQYSFPNGIQTEEHPHPGVAYSGTSRVAYLPDNAEGRQVRGLLEQAFESRLTFTVGASRTTGQQNTVTWNDIHHKTSKDGGPQRFGYPDPSYLSRVKDELAAKGISPLTN